MQFFTGGNSHSDSAGYVFVGGKMIFIAIDKWNDDCILWRFDVAMHFSYSFIKAAILQALLIPGCHTVHGLGWVTWMPHKVMKSDGAYGKCPSMKKSKNKTEHGPDTFFKIKI